MTKSSASAKRVSPGKVVLIAAACLLLLLLLAGLAFFVLVPAYKRTQMRSSFVKNTDSLYEQQIPLNEMDLFRYNRALYPAIVSWSPDSGPHMMELPCDIHYYLTPDDSGEPELTLKKGTSVCVITEKAADSNQNPQNYGMASYPDYKKGWRYAKPFATSLINNREAHDMEQCFYVRTDELKAVCGAYWDLLTSDPESEVWVYDFGGPTSILPTHLYGHFSMGEKFLFGWAAKRQFVDHYILFSDLLLYSSGDFCSPDLCG